MLEFDEIERGYRSFADYDRTMLKRCSRGMNEFYLKVTNLQQCFYEILRGKNKKFSGAQDVTSNILLVINLLSSL